MVRGRSEVVLYPRPGGRGSPPLRCVWGRCQRATDVVHYPAEGSSRTPPPTGWRETKAAAYDTAGAVPDAYQWCAGCARGIGYVGRRTEAGEPYLMWVQAVTPSGCNQPAPATTQPRGVEDAAPYGQQRDVGVRIAVNSCANAANLCPPLGSPERGAVAALCAVTEGLVQRGCGEITLPVNPRRAGAEVGWRAEPALSVNRRRRTGDGAPYGVRGTFQHCNYVVRYPTEGASGTPPPTGCACGYVSAKP